MKTCEKHGVEKVETFAGLRNGKPRRRFVCRLCKAADLRRLKERRGGAAAHRNQQRDRSPLEHLKYLARKTVENHLKAGTLGAIRCNMTVHILDGPSTFSWSVIVVLRALNAHTIGDIPFNNMPIATRPAGIVSLLSHGPGALTVGYFHRRSATFNGSKNLRSTAWWLRQPSQRIRTYIGLAVGATTVPWRRFCFTLGLTAACRLFATIRAPL